MMSEKENKVPKRRFKEFKNADAWEQRKVIDVAPLQRGFDLPKEQMEDGCYPVVMSNGVNGYHSKYKAKAPGVVTGRSGTIGNIHYIECNYWPHNTALWVTNFKGNNPLYIYYMYKHLDLNRFGTGSGVPTLNRNDVHSAYVWLPKNEEQKKIAVFFRNLDRLITLHQRKLEKTKALKKAYFTEMFPVEGERKPKLRFAGFTDDWEQSKLGDMVELDNGYAFRSRYFIDEPSGYVVATPGNVKIDGGFYEDGGHDYDITGEIPEKYIFNPGDLFVTMTDLTPSAQTLGNPAIVPKNGVKYLHNQRLGKLTKFSGDIDFLFELLCTKQYHKTIVATASGTTVRHSSPDKILSYITSVPQLPEQQKIGQFFKNLDTLITLQQNKLEKLKNIKKAYLNEMFI